MSWLPRVITEQRFIVMLAGLTVLLLAVPIAVADTFLSTRVDEILILIGFIVMLLAAAFAVSSSRKQTITVLVLTVPTVVLSIVDLPVAGTDLVLARAVSSAVLIAYIIVLITRHLFHARTVTLDTIAASLCAYLLLGVLWAMLYTAQDIISPGSFNYSNVDEAAGGMKFGGSRSIYALYFSFVTLTTLGYGDIAPANAPARMLAAVQAIIGQIYLTVLVARLVGMQIAQGMERERAGGDRSG